MDIERTIARLRREAYGSGIEGLLLDAAATDFAARQQILK